MCVLGVRTGSFFSKYEAQVARGGHGQNKASSSTSTEKKERKKENTGLDHMHENAGGQGGTDGHSKQETTRTSYIRVCTYYSSGPPKGKEGGGGRKSHTRCAFLSSWFPFAIPCHQRLSGSWVVCMGPYGPTENPMDNRLESYIHTW